MSPGETYLMTNQMYGTFYIYFHFFSDLCTLKFLPMKCNPTNKKILAPCRHVSIEKLMFKFVFPVTKISVASYQSEGKH